jgi:methyl-accepting chemotaxis protein
MQAGVQRVGGATDVLAEGAEATSASLLQMARQMASVDEITTESARLWERMVQRGQEALERVQKTAEGVESIRESTRDAERVVKGVGTRADEIGQVLDVIHEVADETKLLALNAAIIAAQAGSGGHAFAVVASQIKALAQRVTQHTKEVEQLIHAVQDESRGAIEVMDRGARSVDVVVTLSTEAGEAVGEITRSSRDSGEQIQRIAREVRDQSRAAQQVVEQMQRTQGAIDEIRDAVAAHGQSNQVLVGVAGIMGEAARQICDTALALVGSTERIRDGIDGVKDASEAVESALQAQSQSTQSIAEFLERVGERASENHRSAELTSDATQQLSERADALDERVRRFKL